PGRGCGRAKVTICIDDNCYPCWNSCPANPGDECGCLNSNSPDADGVGLCNDPWVANIDIVTASGEFETGVSAQCDVAMGGRVVVEREITSRGVGKTSRIAIQCTGAVSRVVVAGCVTEERQITGGRIERAVGIAVEGQKTVGSVADTLRVAKKCLITGCSVAGASCVAKECIKTDCRVVDTCVVQKSIITEYGVGVRKAAFLASRSHVRRKRKAGESERNE